MFVDEYTIKARQEGVFKNMFLLLFTNEIGFLIHIYILNRVLTQYKLLTTLVWFNTRIL